MKQYIFIRHKGFRIFMGSTEPTAANLTLAQAEAEAKPAEPAKKSSKTSEE